MVAEISGGSGPRVPDAGGAAEADEIEPELVEVGLQPRLVEVGGDDLRAGRQRGLDPGPRLEALLHRIAREQPRRDQHAGVGGIGAAGDGGDDDVAVAEVEVAARDGRPLLELARLLVLGLQRLGEAGADVGQRDAALGPLRAGERRHHRAEVELERVGEHGIGRVAEAEQALRLGVVLDERDAVRLAAGDGEVGQRLGVDGEEAAGRAVLRRHVGDGGAVGERHRLEAGAEELDELADHALLAQHLRHGEHQVGRGHALLELAGQPEADHLGDQHGLRLAEHGGLRLDAAHAPAEHGEAVDHGGVAVGADEGVGVGERRAVGQVLGPHRLRQELEVDLVADAGAGRHHAEIVEGALAPLEEDVALAVALVLVLDVALERGGRAELVDDHRVVDDEVDGDERVDLLRVAAEALHAVAHGGEIDDRRHAGEVLHQDARRAEADLLAGGALVVDPGGERLDVVLGDGAAVLVAQEVLEQHLHGEGQPRDAGEPVRLGLGQRVVDVGLAAGGQVLAALEAIERDRRHVVQVDPSSCSLPSAARRALTFPGARQRMALICAGVGGSVPLI